MGMLKEILDELEGAYWSPCGMHSASSTWAEGAVCGLASADLRGVRIDIAGFWKMSEKGATYISPARWDDGLVSVYVVDSGLFKLESMRWKKALQDDPELRNHEALWHLDEKAVRDLGIVVEEGARWLLSNGHMDRAVSAAAQSVVNEAIGQLEKWVSDVESIDDAAKAIWRAGLEERPVP